MTFRPPAVPLITHDPYFSVWSFEDRLTDGPTRHWTGQPHPLCGIARVDGRPFRFLGSAWEARDTLEQKSLTVWPTRTVAVFEGAGVRLTVTFTSPLLPDDLEVLSRPLTYVAVQAVSTDGQDHEVGVYLDVAAHLAVNSQTDEVTWGRVQIPGLTAMRVGSLAQRALAKRGDDLRIDWGWAYLAIPSGASHLSFIGPADDARKSFAASGQLPESDDTDSPRAANDGPLVLAAALDFGGVGADPVERFVMAAYDDGYSLEYMGRRLRPLWRANGDGTPELLQAAQADYPALREKCRLFDEELSDDLAAAGGEGYARLAGLAYRQCIAAHKLASDGEGGIVFFSKENFSNGCINTVDVTYPSSPFFLLLQPALLKAQLGPIMSYAASDHWPFPFAPHDLGTYPVANGQVYGAGEKSEENQMPIEECGNMLVMVAALTKVLGDADFAAEHWGVLEEWATYLRVHGTDPENQLCTDDFAGHMAHNANLAIKAVMGVAAFGSLCAARGRPDEAAEWHNAAQVMAVEWVKLADDGTHFRLAFDQPGTWSQKYNMVWDHLLGLDVLPADVVEREWRSYLARLNDFGLPLDSRADYTKTDWQVWTATLCEDPDAFHAIVDRVVRFAAETPDRVPLSDWYDTRTSKHVGFRARSVVGGVYIPLLRDAGVWRKWVDRADPTVR